MASPTLPPAREPASEALECPRCGSPVEAGQGYCLECGERLPARTERRTALAGALERPSRRYPGDWVWPVLVTLVVAVLAAAAVVGAEATRNEAAPYLTATLPVGGATTESVPAEPTLSGPVPTATVTLPEEEPPPPPPAPRPRKRGVIRWPQGTNGFTVVLASVPKGSGAAARERARNALAAGLTAVGILDSSRYPSLTPGYLVVFSGVFESRPRADEAARRAQSAGYDDAYTAQVAR